MIRGVLYSYVIIYSSHDHKYPEQRTRHSIKHWVVTLVEQSALQHFKKKHCFMIFCGFSVWVFACLFLFLIVFVFVALSWSKLQSWTRSTRGESTKGHSKDVTGTQNRRQKFSFCMRKVRPQKIYLWWNSCTLKLLACQVAAESQWRRAGVLALERQS